MGRGARSYPLLYLLTRVRDGVDLLTGRPLGQDSGTIEVHEIFPKAALVKAGYSRAEVNDIANFAFVGPSSASRRTARSARSDGCWRHRPRVTGSCGCGRRAGST